MKSFKRNMVKKRIDMVRRIAIGIVFVVAILIVALLVVPRSREDGEAECASDSDCVKVQTTCCSCSMGGEEKCVPKENASFYEEKLKECGENLFCAAVYNCEIEECGCEGGKCTG
jgi:hypothetical protein